MTRLLLLVVGLVLVALLARAIWRSTELFALKADAGRTRLVRGRLPQSLMDDLSDVVARADLDGVTVRAVIEGGQPRIVTAGRGVDDGVLQQLRNVIGRYQTSQIRAGGRRA